MSQREMPPTVDRISALPDEVLCHILSFLPTKLAFATSVLSKRWSPLWRSVPTLHLDDERVQEKKTYLRFGRFVKAVTRSRDLHQPIKRFRLKCRSELCARFNVNKWVKSAIRRRVEHLELSLPSVINLAPRILSCRTLVVLKLSRLTVSAVSSVDFPSLKILRLNKVHFHEHRYVKELLSGCPILEDLQTIDLLFDQHFTEGGYKSLPNLVRADISTFDVPLSAISNVESLRIDMMDVLSDDQAVNAYYKDIPLFHNLISVELRFFDSPGWDQVVEVLEHCPKLQILVVEKRKSDSLFYGANWAYPKSVPECLSLHLRTCSLGNYGGWQGELRFATYIMQNARLLQIMTIRSASSSNPMQKLKILKELSSCPRISPTCKLLFECK